MAFQTLTIDLNANLQKLQGDLDKGVAASDQAFARIQQSANAAGGAIGNAANQADFGDLSKDAKAAAVSMDALRGSTTATGTEADKAKSKLAALFEEIDRKAGEAYDGLAEKGKVVGTAISVAIGLALAGTVAGAVYGVVRSLQALGSAFSDFVVTGKGYQSANIDALDAQDQKVRQLQTDLVTTAEAASVLDLVFKQTGVPKDDYTSVYTATADAIRKATDQQKKLNSAVADARQTGDTDKITAAETAVDQYSNAFMELGIQYQDAKGKALDTTTVIANSAKALGDYAQGYDRNAAAAALAVGTYSKVAAAARVDADSFGTAQSRLKDYLLVIGPNSQAALDEYHKAVTGFKTESDLMSQGFKAAIADAILPTLTGLADYFKDGFPSAVGVFREVLTAAVATLEFFKIGVFAIAEPVVAAFESIGIGAAAGMLAVQKALHFDFSGALHELDEGRKAIIDRFANLPAEVGARIAIAEKNINLARGSDSTDANAKLGDKPVDTGAGRTYTPRTPNTPDKPKATAATPNVDVAKKELELQLKALDLFIGDEKQLLQSRDEFLNLYYQHGDVSIRDYFAQRKTVQDDYVASARKGYAEEIADLEAYIAKTKANGGITEDQATARVTEANTKLIEVRNKLRKVETEASQETLRDWFANRDAVEAYGDKLTGLIAQIHTFSGDTAKAFEIQFETQNRHLKRELDAVLNSDSSTKDDRDKAAQAIVDLDQIRQQGLATAKLNDLSTQRSAILGDLANQQDRITLAVDRGSKTELQGVADSDAANKARVGVLEQIAVQYDAIAEASANLQDRVNADALHVQLDKLKSQTHQLADAFNDAGKDITENFIDKLTDKTATLHDKIKSLLDDIGKRVLKQGEDLIGNYLFGKDGGLLSGIGKTLESVVKPSAGAMASSIPGALGKVSGASSDASNDAMGDFIKSIESTNTSLTDLSNTGIAGMAKNAYEYIVKQIFGTTTQGAATTATTTATTALSALTSAATSAAAALSAVSATGGGGSGVSSLAGLAGAGGGSGDALLESGLLTAANGYAFSAGNVIPFARGDVFSQPTLFPTAGGQTGMLGEAGPEAIMPLRRMPGGRLGVATQAAQAPPVQKSEIHLHYYPAPGESRATTSQRGATLFRQGQLAAARNA